MGETIFSDSEHFAPLELPESGSARADLVRQRQMDAGASFGTRQTAGELGFWGTSYEMYMQETVVGDVLRYGIVPTDRNYSNYEYRPGSFNPYRFYMDNRDTYADMDQHIKGYLFDDVYDEQQFKDRVERFREYEFKKEQLANGSVLGMLVGGIAGFADITTLIPGVNVAKKASTIGKIGRWALAGGYYSAVQEGALHLRQELRTLEESGFNIAAGTAIGGGFGVFGRALDPNSPLYYAGRANPLNPDNPVRMGIGRIGTGMKDNVVIQATMKNGEVVYKAVSETAVGRSVGAAAVKSTELAKSGAIMAQGPARAGVKAIGKAGEFATKKLGAKVSPIVRGLTHTSGKMRDFTEKMYNIGGILTENIKAGIFKPSVDDWKFTYMSRFEMEVLPAANDEYISLVTKIAGRPYSETRRVLADAKDRTKQLGKDVVNAARGKNVERNRELTMDEKLHEWEFHDLTFKALFDDITPDELANLQSRFGDDNAEAIVDAAMRQAKRIHTMNRMFTAEMRDKGFDFEDLGDDYGVAQLWIANGIRANKGEAKNFFLEVLGSKPSDEFIEEYGLTVEQFNKLGVEEVTVTRNGETVTLTKEEGTVQKGEMLEDWAAGEKTAEEAALDAQIEIAEQRLKTASRNATLAGRELRKSWTEIKNASLDELKKMMDRKFALRQRSKAEIQKLQAEKSKAANELKAVEEEIRIRANQFHDTTRATARLKNKRGKAVKEAEALLKMVEDEGAAASAKDVEFARDELIKADNEVAMSGEDALREAVDKAARKPVSSRRLATLQERIRNLEQRIKMKEDALKQLDTKLAGFTNLVNKATATKQQVIDLQKLKRKMNAEAQKGKRQAKRDLKKLKRQRKKGDAALSLNEYVDDLVRKLGDNETDALGGYNSELINMESGRTKRRHIRLTNAQRREAMRLGILRDDLYGIMQKGVDDISTQLALRQVFGNKGVAKMVQDEIAEVQAELQPKIDAAPKGSRQRRRLERQLEIAENDIKNGFKRQLGVLGLPSSPDDWIPWLTQQARAFNYVRYGSGFLIPSTADLSNVVFTSGFGTFTASNFKAWNRTMSQMSNREIRMMALASERILQNSTVMKMNQAEAGREMTGIGNYGSLKHNTTSTIERVLGGLGEATNVASGMQWWNTRMKALAMVQMQDTFVRHMLKWDEISAASANNIKSQKIVAEMASLGLGSDQIRIIRQMMEKYPPQLVEGIYELDMGRWLKEDIGQDAYEAINVALNSVATRAIMTPGKGDTPFLMSNNYAKMVLQFQTYGFVSLNKYMLPAFQRMANYGDMQAFMSMVLAAGLGYGIVAATDIKRNGEIKDRSVGQWGYDIVDRAGFLMFLSTPISAGANTFGMTGASRYSQERQDIGLILGPTGGLFTDIMGLTRNAVDGDMERVNQSLNKLMPFKLYKQIADVALEKFN